MTIHLDFNERKALHYVLKKITDHTLWLGDHYEADSRLNFYLEEQELAGLKRILNQTVDSVSSVPSVVKGKS